MDDTEFTAEDERLLQMYKLQYKQILQKEKDNLAKDNLEKDNIGQTWSKDKNNKREKKLNQKRKSDLEEFKESAKNQTDSDESDHDKKAGSIEYSHDAHGNTMMALDSYRHVSVAEFKKTKYVNIRNYYLKDEELLPTKKGVSLNLESYESLKQLIPAIDKQISKISSKR